MRDFFDSVKKELGIVKVSQWQEITAQEVVRKFGGGALLNRYNNSLAAALEATYGEECSVLDCTGRASAKFLKSTANQRVLIHRIASRLGIAAHSPEDWKKVDRDSFRREGGSGLLYRYGSVHDALISLRPLSHSEVQWAVHRCRPTVPFAFWKNDDNVREFLEYNAEKLGIEEPQDWLRVSRQDLATIGGSALLKGRSLIQALSVAFPHEKWEEMRVSGTAKRSCQRNLRLSVAFLFPELPRTAALQ